MSKSQEAPKELKRGQEDLKRVQDMMRTLSLQEQKQLFSEVFADTMFDTQGDESDEERRRVETLSRKGAVLAFSQDLDTTDRKDVATVAAQGLPPDELRAVALSAARGLPLEDQAKLGETLIPEQKTVNQIWLVVVVTFSIILLLSALAAIYAAIAGAAQAQIILLVFTPTATLLAGLLAGKGLLAQVLARRGSQTSENA